MTAGVPAVPWAPPLDLLSRFKLRRTPGSSGGSVPSGIFVAPGGSNSGPGTSVDTPWATLAYAASNAPAGVDIWVRGGLGNYTQGVTISRSGLRFRAYPGDPRPHINVAAQFPVQISAADTVFQGFEVSGANTQWGAGIRVTANVNTPASVWLDDNVIHDCRSFAVYCQAARGVLVTGGEWYACESGAQISDAGSNIVFDGIEIHDFTEMVVRIQGDYGPADPLRPGSGDRGANAFVFTRSVGPSVVRNCLAYGLRAFSSQYETDGGFVEFYECSNVLVEDNVVWDAENFTETGNGSGAPACSNLTLIRNLMYRGTERNPIVYPSNWSSSKGTFTAGAPVPPSTNGCILRSCKNSLVAHNTFVDMLDATSSKTFAIDITQSGAFAGGVDGLKVLNNLCRGSTKQLSIDSAMPVDIEIDHNLYQNTSGGSIVFYQPTGANYTTLSAFQAASVFEDHGVQAAPLFANEAADDYTLQAGSPAINAGKIDAIPGESYLGAAPDIGVFEKA